MISTLNCRYAASPVLREPVVLKNHIEVRGRLPRFIQRGTGLALSRPRNKEGGIFDSGRGGEYRILVVRS
jgi:hypothetical protein